MVGDGPVYSNSINSIPAIKFDDNSDANHLQISDASFLNDTDYSIMIAEKRIAQNSDINYLLGGNDDEDVFGVGYSSDGVIIQTHGEVASNDNSANVEALTSYSNKPRVLLFTHSSTEGNKIYINGVLANEDTTSNATTHLSNIATLNIGKNYNGEIGEIAIFSRALKQVEIADIRDYLSDKYNAPNNSNIVTSCDGTVTATGCEQTCSAPTINGATTSITADGANAEFRCSETGYSGNTLTYTCSNGSLSPTPSASDCVDVGCASGYYINGGQCVQGCSVASITGTTDSGSVVADGTTVTCDETGYDGSTIGTCSSGNAITGSCTSCASGYNYNSSNSACEQQCSLDLTSYGISDTVTINSGASTYDCSTYGDNTYTGTITLASACNNGGGVSVASGTCEASASGLNCTSNTDTQSSAGSDIIHIFTTVGSHTLDCTGGGTGDAWILVIGGGGGGGYTHGGGGGAGEFIELSAQELTASSYTITVGSGGAGGKLYSSGSTTVRINSENGGNSSFIGDSISITALGGGAGGSHIDRDGQNGGSGGGAGTRTSNYGIAVSGSGSIDSNHFANDGGANYSPNEGGANALACTAGGGGAESSGGDCDCDIDSDGTCSDENIVSIFGGAGGNGKSSSITGSEVTYAAGGAGGCRACTSRLTGGSNGIGGDAGYQGAYRNDQDDDDPTQNIYDTDGTNGDDGTGSGGGGAGGLSAYRGDGGNGGSGIVIIRYTNPPEIGAPEA
ncbi:MAG: hypothetical protein ISQ34_02440 [Rickettsiales bacterium]|nr:hypothetical protein [Rickettsiales bacterium]